MSNTDRPDLSPAQNESRSPRQWHRRLVIALVGILMLGIAGEWYARWKLGLGDPPLSIADPEIEYLFKPGDYYRFGNRVKINQYHMRSDDFTSNKTDPAEWRVMVFGDSVINGGNLTDQEDLASERLRRQLRDTTGRSVVVGNISAGSWGPGNLLAYARRFGFFDADVVVIVVNSGDATDNPTYTPIVGVHPGFPERAPWLALQEGFSRYLLPRLSKRLVTAERDPQPDATQALDPTEVKRAMSDLAALIAMARDGGIAVVLAHHPDRRELSIGPFPGYEPIRRLAQSQEVVFVDLFPVFQAAIEVGKDPYRAKDHIHPNAEGQRLIAQSLLGPVSSDPTK
jgi:hypothetical protein